MADYFSTAEDLDLYGQSDTAALADLSSYTLGGGGEETPSYSLLGGASPSYDTYNGYSVNDYVTAAYGGNDYFTVNPDLYPTTSTASDSTGLTAYKGWIGGAGGTGTTGAKTGTGQPTGSSGSPSSYLSASTKNLGAIPVFNFDKKFKSTTYEAPEWDEERVSEIANERAQAGRSQLRRGLQSSILGVEGAGDSPIVQKYTLGKVWEGFGTGIAKNEDQAAARAESEYGKEYAAEVQEGMTNAELRQQQNIQNYQTEYNSAMQEYNAALNAWLSGALNTSTNTGIKTR